MGTGAAAGCLVTLALWQSWQSLHQAATCEDRQGQTKRLEMRRRVALMPGWARLWTASKMGRRKATGTSGLKTPEEVSTSIGQPSRETVETRREEENGARLQSGHPGWAAANAAKSTGGGGMLVAAKQLSLIHI